MNKDEIEAMGKFFRQAFDMSNGSPNTNDVKYEMTQKAKEAFDRITERLDTAVQRGTEGRRKLREEIDKLKGEHQNLTEHFDSEMNRLRKDYRSLQSETISRLDVIETWIRATTHKEKETIRLDMERKQNKRDPILASNTKSPTTDLVTKYEQVMRRTIHQLDLSVRTTNALRKAHINCVRDLTRWSKIELRKLDGMGLKCVLEVETKMLMLGVSLAYKSVPPDTERRKETA